MIKRLLSINIELNNPHGIMYTPWFQARNSPEIADLLLNTKGAIRLTLTSSEQQIIDELLYSEEIRIKDLHKLNTPELVHAFILEFNWDDDISVIEQLVNSPNFKEITAIEVFELIDATDWLTYEGKITDLEQYYVNLNINLIQTILDKFPQMKKYEALYERK